MSSNGNIGGQGYILKKGKKKIKKRITPRGNFD